TKLSLKGGETVELTLLLGEESTSDAAVALIERYRSADLDAALKEVGDFWDRTVSVIQVKTPDRSLDIMVNGWLLYQTLACRIWGRTAFYQSSGAYGYRDQLQDSLAMCVSSPATLRAHTFRAAARQLGAGDVQPRAPPPPRQGSKALVSDDRVCLAFVTAHYLEVPGDESILDESVPFLGGGPLAPGQMESFSAPPSGNPAPLLEHC